MIIFYEQFSGGQGSRPSSVQGRPRILFGCTCLRLNKKIMMLDTNLKKYYTSCPPVFQKQPQL